MIEVADVFRRFASGYINKHSELMLPSHRRAILDIIGCRTEAFGGHAYRCDRCNATVYSYHSCKNRSCPKCHTKQMQQWLEKRQAEMLPVPYFHIISTVPAELRRFFRSNQKDLYSFLMKATAQAIVELARDPRYCGGQVGVLQVLHTWTAALFYHVHVHCLVPAGGVSADGQDWLPTRRSYFLPEAALSPLIRGKFRALVAKHRPDLKIPRRVWKKKWVVDCVPWGEGQTAVLEYLARYVFRIAISNARIIAMDDSTVTFRYKDRKRNEWKTRRLVGEQFMQRFLQHVLPKGFHKVRYIGLWHHSHRGTAQRIRLRMLMDAPPPTLDDIAEPGADAADNEAQSSPRRGIYDGCICPHCGEGRLFYACRIERKPSMPP